ncbi:putative NTE family protein YlbK [Clostridia bacterium]|nr:putative NTE family protein YlbK [Clostridia bacterium]
MHPKIGLAFGAGAMRGLAHIGVLQVIEREHIPIDVVTGTSMGSIIAGAYASGRSGLEMEKIARDLQELSYFDLTMPKLGVIQGKRISKLIGQITRNMSFADTRVPCGIVACALETGDEVILTDGSLEDAIRASISIPGVFVPVELDGRLVVDGGLVNRVPVSVARMLGAEKIIGIDVGYRGESVRPNGLVQVIMQAYEVMEWQVAKYRSNSADIMIVPDVRGMNPAHMMHAADCIARGREAARAMLPDIRAMLNV